jgi:tyrosinase
MSKLLINGSPQPPKVQGVAPPARLEVHEFVKNDKYFSLYIQALRKYPSLSRHWQWLMISLEIIYSKPSSAVASWFQIGGIHGVNATWNSSPGQQNGYCVHGLPRFSTWHRGYVVLIEVSILSFMFPQYLLNKINPLI